MVVHFSEYMFLLPNYREMRLFYKNAL